MIGRTNSGSGGISLNAAILVVYAPLGSIVTAMKGSITKASKKDIELSDRPTVGMHLISIGSSQFGTWTVTASRGTETNSTTVTVNAVQRYEIYIGYHVPLDTYQEVEYLQSSGSQGLLLSGSYGKGTTFEIKIQPTVRPANGGQFLGFGTGGSRGNHQFDQNWGAYYNSNYQVLLEASALPTSYALITGSFQNNGLNTTIQINGQTNILNFSYSPPTYNGTTLFYSRNSNGNAERGSSRIFYYKVWINEVAAIEAYPCYRLSDSVAGFYDKVNDTFYTNNGSGTFIVGADV